MSEQYIITISREFGSLGRPIARRMSEILGIMYYDRDIVEEVSKQLQLPVPTISDVEERAPGSYFSMRFPLGNMTSDLQNKVFRAQQDIITELADRESCIIVGRCADYVLREKKNLMRVYIYTSYENKYDNCVNNLSMTPREAKKMIRDVDQARIAYHMRYAGYMPDENKDIQIDSAFLGVEGTAWYLSQAAKHRFGVE
ncbi:MAG: cytidylate kinase-like family protein [Oscillospiraceae bacterium]|nr:cytidylate kinase-like family protein [Eubacteriales bacterium]MDY2617242.1 cytidylate kinase-like family protein [Oscillospiraceae bacterium]